MKQNKLFNQTRWRLAKWYAVIFSLILGISALAVYEAIAHAHKITLNQELETVGATIHDSLEPILLQPETLNHKVVDILPNLCLIADNCFNNHHNRNLIGAIANGQYYLQFFDLSQNLLAVAGIKPEGLSIEYSSESLKTIQDSQGIRYRQISLELHTQDDRIWGYLHIGKSLRDFDIYVANVKWVLLLTLPVLIIGIMFASWWLAGFAIQPIYQSYQQIQQFSADVAHELRTPLAAIQATIESSMMLSTLSEKEGREVLGTIKRQNQRLSSLVADLLMLCRMERQLDQNYQFLSKPVILNDLINDLAEEFAALAKTESISLISQIKVNQPLKVMGNEEQLYRLVTNLVINAIQHTLKEGKVTLVLKQENHKALIEIIDTGVGIAEDEQNKIFDRFYRVNKARSRDKGGSGLGLAIAKTIVLNHGGKIEVGSKLNQGSTFTIYLPTILK